MHALHIDGQDVEAVHLAAPNSTVLTGLAAERLAELADDLVVPHGSADD